MLERSVEYRDTCLFVAVPDVVADWTATLKRYETWHPIVRDYGYPRAIVLQDGAETHNVPWDECEAIFIGGSTEWKLSHHAASLTAEAKRRCLHAHMGRVNSYRRLAYADSIGCDTADGTFLKFAPDANLPRVLHWLDKLDSHRQRTLWTT